MVRYLAYVVIFFLVVFSTTDSFSKNDVGFRFNNRKKSRVSISIQVVNNLIIVPVKINNSPPFNFLLDTGVKTTILSEPLLLNFLQSDSSEAVLVLGLGKQGYIIAEKLKNITFLLEGITGEKMDMIVLPEGIISLSEHLGFPVYGILGYDLFKQFPVYINYSANIITLYKESTYRVPKRRTTKVPMKIKNSKPYINAVITSWDGKVDTVEMLVDLGASAPILLNEEYKDYSEKHIQSYLGKGISGKLFGTEGRVKSFKIADIEFNNPIVSYPKDDYLFPAEAKIEQWDGIIGGGLLKRFQVIIDYSESVLYLKRNYRYNEPMFANLSGMEVIAEGLAYNKFKVDFVRPNSAADIAGVKEGDYIITINNHPSFLLTLDEIVSKLNTRPKDFVTIRVQRDDKILIKKITLKSDL
jgi:hypothetical protein